MQIIATDTFSLAPGKPFARGFLQPLKLVDARLLWLSPLPLSVVGVRARS